MSEIVNWLNDNETALSALAALVVIIGVVLSPLGAGLRGLLSRSKNTDSVSGSTPSTGATTPAVQDFLNTAPPLITDKPSIAVLPFVNMSDDKSQEYFADGMTEDIITGLSCDSRLFVIARNSTFAYKGQSPDIRTVGKELGVRYVLEGSIRPIGDRLRITVQLIESTTGTHVWADKIDRPVAEIFDIQDDVVDSLVSTLCANVGVAEGQRARRQPPENLRAWELCVRAEMAYIGQLTPIAIDEALILAKKATEIEPGYGFGWALLGYLMGARFPNLLSNNIAEDSAQVINHISKAVALAPEDPAVLGYAGFASLFAGQAAAGVNYLERSLAINPNNGVFRMAYGSALTLTGRQAEALTQYQLFFRQSPKDPNIGRAYFYQSYAFIALEDYVEAEKSAVLAIKYIPTFVWSHMIYAIALSALDRHDEARQVMRRCRQIAPHWTLEKLEEFHVHYSPYGKAMNSLTRRVWNDQ